MSSENSPRGAVEPHAPLLRSRQGTSDASRTPTLALLLGRATGRRGPSMMVRETAARELEERRADWGYSKPVVALDISWNMAFVVVSAVMLICTLDEKPNTPIRLWICGYAAQCLVHVVLVWLEYRRRNRLISRRRRAQDGDTEAGNVEDLNDSEDEEIADESSLNSSRPGWVEFFLFSLLQLYLLIFTVSVLLLLELNFSSKFIILSFHTRLSVI